MNTASAWKELARKYIEHEKYPEDKFIVERIDKNGHMICQQIESEYGYIGLEAVGITKIGYLEDLK